MATSERLCYCSTFNGSISLSSGCGSISIVIWAFTKFGKNTNCGELTSHLNHQILGCCIEKQTSSVGLAQLICELCSKTIVLQVLFCMKICPKYWSSKRSGSSVLDSQPGKTWQVMNITAEVNHSGRRHSRNCPAPSLPVISLIQSLAGVPVMNESCAK